MEHVQSAYCKRFDWLVKLRSPQTGTVVNLQREFAYSCRSSHWTVHNLADHTPYTVAQVPYGSDIRSKRPWQDDGVFLEASKLITVLLIGSSQLLLPSRFVYEHLHIRAPYTTTYSILRSLEFMLIDGVC